MRSLLAGSSPWSTAERPRANECRRHHQTNMALKLHIGMAGPQVGTAENREEARPAVDDDDEEPGATIWRNAQVRFDPRYGQDKLSKCY
jgi:hypothetical protein